MGIDLVSQDRYFPVSVTMRDSQIKNLTPPPPTDTGLMMIKLAFCEEHSILIYCLIYFVTPVFTLLSRLESPNHPTPPSHPINSKSQ